MLREHGQAAHGAAREEVERAVGPRVTTEPGCGAKPHFEVVWRAK
jgi:hypothetical protein